MENDDNKTKNEKAVGDHSDPMFSCHIDECDTYDEYDDDEYDCSYGRSSKSKKGSKTYSTNGKYTKRSIRITYCKK